MISKLITYAKTHPKGSLALAGLLILAATAPWVVTTLLATKLSLLSLIPVSFICAGVSFMLMKATFFKQKTDKPDPAKCALRDKVISEILEINPANINALKEKLKQLFELRAHANITHKELEKHFEAYSKESSEFLSSIKSLKEWDKPANQTTRTRLMLKAILFTDNILARIEKDIREAGEIVNVKTLSERLTTQKNRKAGHAYFWHFMYHGVVDFYHIIRDKLVIKEGWTPPNKDEAKAVNASFFAAGTPDNNMRKLWNTTVKYGLEKPYGGKEALRKQLLIDDQRFEHWTHKDSKKHQNLKDKGCFRPFPDTRPT